MTGHTRLGKIALCLTHAPLTGITSEDGLEFDAGRPSALGGYRNGSTEER